MTSEEDPRYTRPRLKWKGNESVNVFLRIYMVQAVGAVIVLSPVIFINTSVDSRVNGWVVTGLIVWLIGFVIEAEADHQLQRFRRQRMGSNMILHEGLWKYARHPNYFGEILQWWGIYIMAATVPYGWMSIVGPLYITAMLLFVYGIPTVERSLSRKPGWKKYKQSTRLLVPLPHWQ